MKKKVFWVLCAVLLCTAAQAQQIDLGIIPTPQQVTLSADSKAGQPCVLGKSKVKEVQLEWGHEAEHMFDGNGQQAYRIVFEPKRITIYYADAEGREYAHITLDQLRQLHETIPCCTITDWPAIALRGWMDDQSRGPVPHAAYRQYQWQTLHTLKFNFCNYYTEHTLYQTEYPDLAPAYLADCAPHPDEVINLQLFAHAEKTLRVPFYEHLMDSRANYNPATAAVYDFLRQRIDAAYKRIPKSPYFIINCDETEQLGTGRAKQLVASKGSDQVYVDFINRCYAMVKEECHTASHTPAVAMWGDIVAKNPQMMRQLPKDMIYIMWAYEPLDDFSHLIRPFREQGNPFWVAASTGHSATMTSTPQRYIKNIANLYRDGYRDGAAGAMLTCWDDNGEALFDNSWHAQYWAAEMAWNPLKTDNPEELSQREQQFNRNFERLFYNKNVDNRGGGDKVSDLYAVGSLMYNPLVADWYTSAALMEPLLGFNPDNTSPAMSQRIEQVFHLIDSIHIDSAANPHAHYALNRIWLTAQKCRLRLAIHTTLAEPTMQEDCKAYAADYLQALFNLKREYLRLWDQENGEYERYIVCNRYDQLAREVIDLDRHVFVDVSKAQSTVALRTLYNDRPIYYTLDGSSPTMASAQYAEPFPLERSATIKAISYNEYAEGVVTEQYLLSHKAMGKTIALQTPYSTYKAVYSGGGNDALTDGQLGSDLTYADGHWQGYWGDSIDAIIDLGTPTELHSVEMRFMQNTFDWILAPTAIRVYSSDDATHWQLLSNQQFDMDPRETGMRLKHYTVSLEQHTRASVKEKPEYQTARYLRVVVPNAGALPSWHPAPGQPSYLFTDEIILQ